MYIIDIVVVWVVSCVHWLAWLQSAVEGTRITHLLGLRPVSLTQSTFWSNSYLNGSELKSGKCVRSISRGVKIWFLLTEGLSGIMICALMVKYRPGNEMLAETQLCMIQATWKLQMVQSRHFQSLNINQKLILKVIVWLEK